MLGLEGVTNLLKDGPMRSLNLRSRFAVRVITAALIAVPLVIGGASAAQANSNCSIKTGSLCEFQNNDHWWISGAGHGTELFTSASTTDHYFFTVTHNPWGQIKDDVGLLCWNESGGSIFLDSCQPVSYHNELFNIVPCHGAWCIQNYALGTSKVVAGFTQGNPLFFTGTINAASEWNAIQP